MIKELRMYPICNNFFLVITVIAQPWLEECCFDYDDIDVSKLKKILKIQ